MSAHAPARLTLGPLLFHWPEKKRRDFYLQIADEAPIDTVYLGEVVCSKREVASQTLRDEAIARLTAAGKEVVLSTLALVTTPREIEIIRDLMQLGLPIEANDVACLQLLAGTAHVVGPYINVFNEGARDFVIRKGARRIVLPVEMPARSIGVVAGGAAEFEMQVFGRQPLSVAMRCYHARAHDLTKDHCQLVCGLDADGLTADTIDGKPLLAINGTQTLSHGYGVLLRELVALRDAGISHFRLSPHSADMVRIATLYRQVLDGVRAAEDALPALRALTGPVPYVNGFLHGQEGLAWREA